MFNHTTHTGPNGQRAAKTISSVAAMVVTGAIGTALVLSGASSAAADSTPASYASGQFLTGSIGGIDLAKLVAIKAASAQNDGSQSMQVSRDPLGVSALGGAVLNMPSGIQLDLGKIVDLGAANQYAQASGDGASMAASGAVDNDGGVGVGPVGSAVDSNAAIDLNALLGSKFASVLSDLQLQANAVTAQASGALKNAGGRYSLAGLTLTLTSPAIAGLTSKVADALGPLDGQLAALDGPDGRLAQSVNGVFTGINPILNLTGADASVDANVSVDLAAAIQPLLSGDYASDGVSFDLQTGVVTVDLAKLLGGKINNEPVGTQVLSDKVVDQILSGITGTVDSLDSQILAKVKNVLANAAVNVDATLNTSTAQAPLIGQTCVTGSAGTGTSGVSGLGGLLGGLTGGGMSGAVGIPICTPTSTALPTLPTSVAVHVHGTVDQLIDGTAPVATATATVLGVPVTVDLSGITNGMGTALTSDLLDGTNGEDGVSDALNSTVLDPAVTGLLGGGSSVENALTHVLSVTLNNQSTTSGTDGNRFTETALEVAAVPDGTNSAARLNMANATVGPNATTVVPTPPGCTSDCSTCTTTDCTTCTTANCGTCTTDSCGACTTDACSGGNPADPNAPTAAADLGNLAFTGVGIGGLVGAILALLAAGAYLVREGYRRNSRRQNG